MPKPTSNISLWYFLNDQKIALGECYFCNHKITFTEHCRVVILTINQKITYTECFLDVNFLICNVFATIK